MKSPAPSGPIWLLTDSRGPGGIETHVTLLAAALRRRGRDAHIVLLDNHGPHPMAPVWAERGLPVRAAGGMRGLARAMRAHRPALVHTHGYKAGVAARLAGRMTGVPVVSTYHAGEPGRLRVRAYTALDRATARLSHNIAVNAVLAKRVPGGAVMIPNFIAEPPAGAAPPAGAESAPAGPAAFVGRLSHEKGPDIFLNIAARLPETPFVIYGDGPMRSALEAAASANVTFMGMKASMDDEWPRIGLLCMSSRHEGLPLAALEAQAHGAPVAAFDVGAMRAAVADGETGWIVPAGDVDALTSAVRGWTAMTPQSRAAFSHAARRHVGRSFSEDRVVPRILKVYDRALSAAG
ncbi:MAG: glycosyltransferase family 4 protein [Rhodospirillales bacterium]